MEKDNLKPFECENGLVYSIPSNHCAFCKHCSDLFWDYSSGPYMFICDLNCEDFEKCGNFSDSGYAFDEQDYIKRTNEKVENMKKLQNQKQKKELEDFYNFLMGLGDR